MKKSLLALAVLGAFAGAASAQTNVTIYGLVDVAVTYEDLGLTNSDRWYVDGGDFTKNGSRLGFKGSEDLGGGLSAIFTLENGFNGDTGTLGQGGRIFGRQAFVGLQSANLGAVKLGRQYTPMHLALDAIDPFATGMVGNIENAGLFNPNGIRMDNTVNYSLTAGGFSGQVAYGFGEAAGSLSPNAQWAAGLGYANGPINVQFAYHDSNLTAAAAGAVPAVDLDTKTAFIGGTFDFRIVKVHAGYQKNQVENAAGVKSDDRNSYMLGLSAPIGAGSIVGSYIKANNDVVNVDIDQYAIGYIHALSKRTSLYTGYAHTETDRAADIDRFQVGIQHKF
jgi:predicted porin